MIVYGYALDHYYTGDGTLMVQVRIPSIHGAYSKFDYNGKLPKNYVYDNDVPTYRSLLLPHLPTHGEVVALCSINESNSDFLVIGLTGGSYKAGTTNLDG